MRATIAHALRGYGSSLRERLRPEPETQTESVLFVFSGGAATWREFGRELYRRSQLVRDGVDAADEAVREIVGFSPSAAYAGAWSAASWEAERRADVVNMGLLSLAANDLLRERGWTPGGALGISLGETTAAYAAGVLSRADAVTVMAWIARVIAHEARSCVLFHVRASVADAFGLCRRAPAGLEFVGESRRGVAVLMGDEEDRETLRAYLSATDAILEEQVTTGRYHVRSVRFDREAFLEGIAAIAPRRPGIPLFSAARGGCVADRPPNAYHWVKSADGPYFFGEAAAAAFRDGYDLAIEVGPPMILDWMAGTAAESGASVGLVDWIEQGGEVPRRPPGQAKKARRQAAAAGGPLDPHNIGQDAVPDWQALRRAGEVQFVPERGAWQVLGHDSVKAALAQPQLFSNAPYEDVDPVLLATDPPHHAGMRRAVARFFTASTLERLTAAAPALAASLIRPELEVVGEYARPFAEDIAIGLLGLPADPVREIAVASVAARQRQGGAEYLSQALIRCADRAALHAALRAAAVGDGEARSLVKLLWLATVATTERSIASAVLCLLSEPAFRERLVADAALVPAFVEEVLRLHAPAPTVRRVTTAPVRLAGVDIPAGAAVQLCLAAANRDPDAFEAPDELRLDRKGRRHLAFGSGIHHCVAAPLARALLPIALAPFLREGTTLHALQPLDGPFLRDDATSAVARLMVALRGA